MEHTIRVDKEVHARLVALKAEAEGCFGRTFTWSDTIRLGIQESRFPTLDSLTDRITKS